MIAQAVFVDQTINAYKGVATGVLLVVVLTLIMVGFIIAMFVSQTDFVRNASAWITKMLIFNVP